jgi:hypothetical protein
MLERMTTLSVDRPKTVIVLTTVLTLLFGLQLPKIHIDTDPENMLEPDQPDRTFYHQVKEDFGINDMIVVGIVDDAGIFRPEALAAIGEAIDAMLRIDGVIVEDVISLSTTDNIRSAGGLLDIRPVLNTIPATEEEARTLLDEIRDNPFLHEKIASEDGRAVAIYLPIERKEMSYGIASEIETILGERLLPGQRHHIAGLPVAEDTFGHEMFFEMAVVAPLAFAGIMLLVWLLFRQALFLVPIGMTAMYSVLWAMGLLIGTGNTVHIMSSMIPVFLMPIAILDTVHILSEFFDRYRAVAEKRRAILEAMRPLYRPMLLTSLTSAVGFASLALADIPPVRVFGLFVAFGIMAAWVFSMTLVPATIALIDDRRLKGALSEREEASRSALDRFLRPVGRFAFGRHRAVIALGIVLIALGAGGIARIRINDNPVKWFKEGHPMRVADTVMNRLFGGTYMAYLLVEGDAPEAVKDPEVVSWIDRLQAGLEADPLVGKTSSVADIVKQINRVLHDNDPAYHAVPESRAAIGQFLFLFQSSGDPNDLDNFLDRESARANIWVQMKSGDNRQMARVERELDEYIAENPPPPGLGVRWSGLTYINKVWQDLMVYGMLKAILGSFVVVFLLMLIEFRSLTMGVLSMIPLSLAIVLSYGLIGWAGRDYDMPVAVCSSLSLGLGIDFAIHFLQRFRHHYRESKDPAETNRYMFSEPGRAIARNAIVISFGFLPLMVSTLTPYVTVGIFFMLLMIFSTLATLFLLPAALRVLAPRLLKGEA